MTHKYILVVLMALMPLVASAQAVSTPSAADSVHTFVVRFPISVSSLSERVGDNQAQLLAFHVWLQQALADSSVTSLQFGGFASPEGPTALNCRLVVRRAASLRQWTLQHLPVDSSLLKEDARGLLYDWTTMRRLVEASSRADREEILSAIRRAHDADDPDAACIASLRRLHQGETWRWLQVHVFPRMRNAYALVTTTARPMDGATALTEEEDAPQGKEEPLERAVTEVPTVPVPQATDPETPDTDEAVAPVPATRRPWYMDVRTNLLYDAALIPNLGLEFSLGRGWSLATNWAWAWWSRRRSDRYWRVFGGELNLRKWFGSRKPLTGHHAGIYVEAFTYDVMLSSRRGYLGGRPSGGMLSHPSWNGGVEYGFAQPIGRRLNLDFTLGLGYFRSTYYEYIPIDTHYVWQATKTKNWVGPTKAEISLVWLWGHGNVNHRKGGGL